LGFNKNVTDSRQKGVFHTLRHSYASRLVMENVDLYTVQKLMGHSTISMTERYSHPAPDHLKKAVNVLNWQYLVVWHIFLQNVIAIYFAENICIIGFG
jgi:integrase